MEILNKITVKAVCGELKCDKPQDLCVIIGVVRSSEEVKGIYGTSHRLVGEFKATNLKTQETFFSGNCFLPAIAESLVIGQLDVDNAIQIAFKIGIRPANNKAGYEYTVKPLIEPAQNNPLAMLESKISVEDIDFKP